MAAFDEMGIASGETRPLYRQVARWLDETPPELLASRRVQAEYMFRRIGITFGVYGDKDAAERLIPFDIVPRLLSRAEWRKLEAGLTQRAQALNLFLKDIYGKRAILKESIIPPELIVRNPYYRPEMIGQRAPHDIWVHIAGIDIVRVDADEFYVLEDNARTPSGVSYMLENREVTMRLLPDLFARHSVAPVDDYPDQLLACLRSVAPRQNGGEASIVILTPGAFNSAYYEHSFLADKLGVELVEGRDLFVEDDQVFMRTTLGPRRVDVIYRRVDDDFLDPLVFNPASVLGVPGLVGAYLAGNVTIANAIGTGIADDKAIYCYMPELIRFYLSEEPLLKNVPTYRCREPGVAQICDGAARSAGGQGGQRVGRLRHAGRPACERRAARAVRRQDHGRSQQLHRPTHPGAVDLSGLVRERRVAASRGLAAVRPFGRGRRAHRARRPHPRRAEGGIAGRQFEPGRRHQGHLDRRRSRRLGLTSMLARTADNLFWLARSMERADYIARTIEATLRLEYLPKTDSEQVGEWEGALNAAGAHESFVEKHGELSEEAALEFLTFDLANPSSIRNCLENARAAGRAVRTALTAETWTAINDAWLELKRFETSRRVNRALGREELMRFLDYVKKASLDFDGACYRTMLRNEAYWFNRLGVFVERADNTARLLDVKYHLLLPSTETVGGPLDYFQWVAILRAVSAATAYHWVYRDRVKPWLIADLLILKQAMPRSLIACYESIDRALDALARDDGRSGLAQRQARAMYSRLERSSMTEIFQGGLHEFITGFIEDNARLSSTISDQYLFN